MKKNMAPPSYPIRNPRTLPREVGRITNPPGNLELGGKGESTRIPLKAAKYKVTDRGK
ncbi:MAG TPA: hypothetical protein VKA83_17770 [Methylomirabilota bacterium]|nr:hypothetical protein [Methylomirabilota bacterium]